MIFISETLITAKHLHFISIFVRFVNTYAMLEKCAVPGSFESDPRYQKMLEDYSDRHFPKDYLKFSLILCRERYDYDDDWFPDTPSRKALFTRYMKYEISGYRLTKADEKMNEDRLDAMYNALYTAYTPQQLNNRLEMLSNLFRKMVSDIEERDKYERSRQDIIRMQAKGGENAYVHLMHKVFNYIEKNYANAQTVFNRIRPKELTDREDPEFIKLSDKAWYIKREAEKILKYKEQLAALAAPRIGEVEGFAVTVKGMSVTFDEQADEETEMLTGEDAKADDGQDSEEGMKGERYTDFRVLRLMETLSPKCRRFLSTIRRTDAAGNYTVDDMMNPQYVGGRQAAIVLRRALVNSTPDSFMSDLEGAAVSNTWINELVRRLRAEPDMRAVVYCDMKKAQSTYVYNNFEKGALTPRIANSRSNGNALAREAGNNMTGGWVLEEEYSIYDTDGRIVSKEKLWKLGEEWNALRTDHFVWYSLQYLNLVKYGPRYVDSTIINFINREARQGNDFSYLALEPVEAMKEFLRRNPELPEKLAKFARGMGFDISAEDISTSAVQPMTQKGWEIANGEIEHNDMYDKFGKNRLSLLVRGLSSILGSAGATRGLLIISGLRNGTSYGIATGQYIYNITSDPMRQINCAVALTKYNEVENRVVNEGKSLSSYNNTSLLHQIVDKLSDRDRQSDEEYRQMLEDNYLQFEGMALGSGENRKLTGWLKKFYDSKNYSGFRQVFEMFDCVGFNHVEYSKMTKAQQIVNAIVMYFSEVGGANTHSYEVPIQSDYSTAYNFIVADDIDTSALGAARREILRKELKEAGDDAEKKKAAEARYDEFIAAELEKNEASPLFEVGQSGLLYASSIVEELTDEVLIELERIEAIEKRVAARGVMLAVYEEQGRKFQIFPEFNDNGFRESYSKITDAKEARDFILRQVAEQLEKMLKADYEVLEREKVLTHPAMKRLRYAEGNNDFTGLYAEHGTVAELSHENRYLLDRCLLNIFYARQQMIKMFTGGLEQFNGLLDYEKRNMLLHAPHSSLYTNATWNDGYMPGWTNPATGKVEAFGNKQYVTYIEDDRTASAVLDDIREMLSSLRDEKVISDAQYRQMLDAYSDIKVTDGQGFRTLDSYRAIMIQSAQWNDELEHAYRRIKRGRPVPQDINKFMHGIKPVYTGYETVPAFEGQKPVRLTILHKYSESVLLPVELAKYCLKVKSAPLMAFDKAVKRLAEDGKRIDLLLMHSGGKVGAFSIVNPFGKDKTTGARQYKTVDEMADCIYDAVTNIPSSVHELDLSGYGIAASVSHETSDERISMATQAEKVGMANIGADDMISVHGREMNARDARELYYQTKAADIMDMYQQLRLMFTDYNELDRLFQEEIAQKGYSPMDIKFALQHLYNGKFAVPLFTPNIEHQVQELLSSIIKKRLTKPKNKGANILQATGVGMDVDASPFEGDGTLTEDEKLRVVFDGTGANKRIKYVEVFMPIHDSRLKVFADKNGGISPARLQELIDDGVIPESLLEFVAYRTPSDAEHSVIPCRVKGFTANIEGATIEMPKEIMVMTGHDYDGDKMRCHFKNFHLVDRDGDDVKLGNVDGLRIILGQMEYDDARFRKCVLDEYDYDKSPLENTAAARNNARIEIFFSQLTSPQGSRRVLIPGGCDETKVIAKSIFITRAAADEQMREVIAGALQKQGMQEADAKAVVKDSAALYDTLIRKGEKKLSELMNIVNGYDTPFSLRHLADSFEYIMGGAEMIGIYAMYNSAFQMFQRLNLRYNTVTKTTGKPYGVSLLGHTYGKLFNQTNRTGRLASLGLARLLNAAVDNGKDPVLGYLHQSPEMAKLTFFMFAAGSTEEDIHLVLNQPAIVELASRLKNRESEGIVTEIRNLINDLAGTNVDWDKKYPITDTKNYLTALKELAKLTRDDFAGALGKTFGEVLVGNDFDMIRQQAAVLGFLYHINGAAEDLANFVRFTRPESATGAIGTSVPSIIAKEISLNEFRDKIGAEDYNTISGMQSVIAKRDVDGGWEPSYLSEVIGTQLPEVVALNALMIDSARDMFLPFFPQARQSWVDVATEIARMYDYRTVSEDLLKKIMNDMILWKLLSDKLFVEGNPQEEQKRIIVDVPKNLRDLKARIDRAHQNPGTDKEAEKLYGNLFLNKFRIVSPEDQETIPRLMFIMDGAPAEGTRDIITSSWAQLMNTKDEGIKQVAIDLFKYNLYTNGFAYGMYEFSHFAPMNVLWGTPEYIEALERIRKENWRDRTDINNFINQYYMNHWGEEKLVPQVLSTRLKAIDGQIQAGAEQIQLSHSTNKGVLAAILGKRYVVVAVPYEKHYKTRYTQTLYRVTRGTPDAPVVLVKASKLGGMTKHRQVTKQYNPAVDYQYIKPVTPGNDSAWGVLDDLEVRKADTYDGGVGDTAHSDQRWGLTREELAAHPDWLVTGRPVDAGGQHKAMEAAAAVVNSDSQIENMSKISDEEAGKIIAGQLVSHLKSQGIKVYDRAAMAEFLKTHDVRSLQQMTEIKSSEYNNGKIFVGENGYGIDSSTEENQYFPEILGQSGKGQKAGRTLAEAADDARGVRGDNGKQKGFPKEKFLAYLEVRARQNGTWIDDISTITSARSKKNGAENEVYLSKDGRSYIKLNRFTLLDDNHNIEEFIDRINSHNEFASNATYEVLGFTENSEGNVCIVLKQPAIKGTEAPQAVIDAYLEDVGFEKILLQDGTEGWSNGTYEIWDADSANVLEDSDGNLYFIDAVINNIERLQQSRKIDDIQFFRTPHGEVYGFVDKEGNIYLDETKISPEHPIHEYTHLWDRAVQKRNPELWKRGVELMKQSGLWDAILNSKNYGKNWQEMGISGERLDNLIASEIHAQLAGKQGAKMLQQLKDNGGVESIVERLKNWMLDFWKALKATFGKWSQEKLDTLTLSDFNNMTVRDFTEGTILDESGQNTQEQAVDDSTVPLDYGTATGDVFGFGVAVDSDALNDALVRTSETDDDVDSSYKSNGTMLNIVERNDKGDFETKTVPATPDNVRKARRQRTFVTLNERLEDILHSHGVGVGVLYSAEARMHLGGVADFDTADVTAAGLVELIRIAEGYEGEQALPEEFAHVALEMLGHDHPLVKRLLNAINSSDEALQEAYDGMYSEYVEKYGDDNKAKLVLEAAGKLVAKHLFREEEIRTSVVRRLVHRVSDAIKDFFRKFSRDEVQNAIFDANRIASKLAREMLGGKLADDMSLDNIGSTGQFLAIKEDISKKQDILSNLLKLETKRLALLKKRVGYLNRNATNAALDATSAQIEKLKKSITNNKMQDAVLSYLSDSMSFLSETEKSLDDAVNSGRKMNSVCRKLNTVRDTIYSFYSALDYIREASNSGELEDSVRLTESLEQISLMLSRFHDKYMKLARIYFEEMLSGVYGEHGKTVDVGKYKGKTISIHDMATRADNDISLASRWFYALADCNDYVLKAVDDITREAKMRARRHAVELRPRIEAAVEALRRDTGDRDQSFMFERDDKGHRTGLYLSEEAAKKKLTPSQKRFYDEMMAIKREVDEYIPSSLVTDKDHRNIVLLRKYTYAKFSDAEGFSAKALVAWEGIKNDVMDMSDNFDPEHKEVVVDFQGNKIDMLPVKFVFKGEKESYDDMTEDVATSLMTFAGMAYEYGELNGVVNILENARYMAAERDVVQKSGNRTKRESVNANDVTFRQPFTKKAARLHAQAALDDFFSMHIYGHTTADEGTIGNTRISKRKIVDKINHIVSLSQMALNLPQRVANVATGGAQVVIESAGRGVYNAKDVTWASGIYVKESADRLAQTGTTDYDNKLSLWIEYFDIHQDNGRIVEKYGRGRMSRIFNENLLYAGLAIGEDYLSSVSSLAVARNFKVKDGQGKQRNLWDAYEVRYRDAANKVGAYLALKDGYTKADGSPITAEDERKFAKKVISLNFEMQGIYNLDDRSAVQQYAFGALIIMYRKWIAPAIKRRYGHTQYNVMTDRYTEGYYRTFIRTWRDILIDAKDAVTEEKGAVALLNIIADAKAVINAYKINYSKLTDYEKSNMKKGWTDFGLVCGLFLSTALLLRLPPDDHDGDELLCWLDSFVLSQLLRLRSELGAQAPTPTMVSEALRLIKSPFAAIGPLKSILNIFQLMLPHNYAVEIKSGRYKGHKKAYKYFREFPIISMFKRIDNFVDPSPLIQYYSNESSFGW